MDVHRTPEIPCPHCGVGLNAAASADDDGPPDEGSLTICMYCSALLSFEGGTLRPVTTTEFKEFSLEQQVSIARAAFAARKAREMKQAEEN